MDSTPPGSSVCGIFQARMPHGPFIEVHMDTKPNPITIFAQCCLHTSLLSDQIRSVAQSCPTLCDPMNRSTPGLLVHHQLPEFTQTHVHRVSNAIQPSHPLLSSSPPAPDPSQHQSLFQLVKSLLNLIPNHIPIFCGFHSHLIVPHFPSITLGKNYILWYLPVTTSFVPTLKFFL